MINKCIACKVIIHPKSLRCVPCRNREIAKINSGENNKLWKGENVSYKHIHGWINDKYGKAFMCQIDHNHIGFFEWANISGEYKRDITDWIMSCHSCNQRMDYYRRYGNACKKGHEFNKENTRINKINGKRECRVCKRKVNKNVLRTKHVSPLN